MPIVMTLIQPDDKNSEINRLQLGPPRLLLDNRDQYLKGREDRTLKVYEEFINSVVRTMGVTGDTTKQQVAQIIDFEIELANITLSYAQMRSKPYHLFKIDELSSNLTPELDWKMLFGNVFANVTIPLLPEDQVLIRFPIFMQNLGPLIKKTPPRVLANYLLWSVVMSRYHTLPIKFQELRKDLTKELSGTNQETARWRQCVGYVNRYLSPSISRMYVDVHFDKLSKDRVHALIRGIKDAIHDILQNLPWMDEATKKFAQDKANSTAENIGYPEYIMNNTELNKDFSEVSFDPTSYFENVMNLLHSSMRRHLQKLRKPVDKQRWDFPATVVNAFYNPTRNGIAFTAGILRPPFYHKNNPMYLNLAGISVIIGHEITHGFDDQGRRYDKYGNVKQWWTDRDIERFNEKAECMVEQYNSYTLPEINRNVNGNLTLGENIADNGGLSQGFHAYQRWVEKNGNEKILPGLELSGNQLFFLNYAQSWCGYTRPEGLMRMLGADPHSPRNIRVNGCLKNSDDFARAYKCQTGSTMNPVNKCRVW